MKNNTKRMITQYIVALTFLFSFSVMSTPKGNEDKDKAKLSPRDARIVEYLNSQPNILCTYGDIKITRTEYMSWLSSQLLFNKNIRIDVSSNKSLNRDIKKYFKDYMMFLVKFQLADFICPMSDEQQNKIREQILKKSMENYANWNFKPEGKNYIQWVESLGFSVEGIVGVKYKNEVIKQWTYEMLNQFEPQKDTGDMFDRKNTVSYSDIKSVIDAQVQSRFDKVYKDKVKFYF